MIGSLRGRLVERTMTGQVLLEVGGVGYVALVPSGTLARLGEPGREVHLHVSTQVREDAITLYGFSTRDERVCFEALLAAQGVGPALALAVLSVHGPDALRRALAEDDVDALCLVPGVGRKTAARLLLDLKARLSGSEPDVEAVVAASTDGNGAAPAGPSPRSEVRAALASLGYGPDEVRDAVRDLPDEGEVGALVKTALSRIGAAR
ncbi:MAG TPA: Holliday junction branch migration protein RuvA [Acidimicrobiales bacterium]|nr:Holliday junction branch migration protein RuvA [Acidimicrobiales bacterium]